EHLQNVAKKAAHFAAKFEASDIGFYSGLWHDAGKFSQLFQSYLNDPTRARGPDHSSAGMVWAANFWDGLAFLIAGHHGGLPSRNGLVERQKKKKDLPAVTEALELAQANIESFSPPQSLLGRLPPYLQNAGRSALEQKRDVEFFLRMVFSALV